MVYLAIGVSGKVSKRSLSFRIMEWLHKNNYGHIHQEWFKELDNRQSFELPIDDWLKENYPSIWEEWLNG